MIAIYLDIFGNLLDVTSNRVYNNSREILVVKIYEAINMEEKKDNIDWHRGFTNAMMLEFIDNANDLEYYPEYQLNQQPLRMDLLIIEKKQDVKIVNEIGNIFRRYNIMEYKSEDDALNIDVLYKVIGYACLYKSYGTVVDERKADEISISIMRDSKPVKMLKHLSENGYNIESKFKGIYEIRKGLLFPIQIIVGNELENKNHVWLTSLRRRIRREQFTLLIENAKKHRATLGQAYIEAVLSVVSEANNDEFNEYRREMPDMAKTWMELMKPEIDAVVNVAVNAAVAKAKISAKLEAYREILSSGKMTLAQIKELGTLNDDELAQLVH